MSFKRQIERAQSANRSPKSLTEIRVSTTTKPLKTPMVATEEVVFKNDLTSPEVVVMSFLEGLPKESRLETARGILRALKAAEMRKYRSKKKAKP